MARAKVDIYNHDKNLERAYEKRLPKFGNDRERIESFIEQLNLEGLSSARQNKYIFTFKTLKKLLAKDFVTCDEEDIKQLVTRIEKTEYSYWTKRDFKVVLKRFLRFLGKEPSWLKSGNGKNPGLLPEEVLTETEVKKIAETGYTTRDKSFILSLYESGCRIGEFLPLKIKHLNFDKFGVALRVTGKTGPRRIRLVFSALALQRWIEEHPAKNNPEAYLWCKTPSPYNPKWKNNHLSYGFVSRLLKEIAMKAGVKKPVNAHAFRHARATFMARHLKEPEMREFFGWGRASEMTSVYVHLSGRDVDNSVLSIYGIKGSTKSQDPILKIEGCPRCNELNDPAAMFCHKCGLPFKEEAVKVENKIEGVVVELLKVIAETNPMVKDRFREIVREKGAEEFFV
jgi:integrase